MTTIYLPNGAKLVIHAASIVSHNENDGCISYSTKVEASQTLLAHVLPTGTVHLLNNVQYNYYPPEINSPEAALKIVLNHLRDLPAWKVKELKARLHDFNALRREWK